MGKLTDFLLMRNLPAARIDRAQAMPMLEQRASLGGAVVRYQSGKPLYPKYRAEVYNDDAYAKIGLVFRCVNLLAASLASAPVRVYETSDGQPSELPDHPLRALLTRPNDRQGMVTFLASVATTMIVTGFCVIEKERAAMGRVVALHPLRSDWIYAVPRDNAPPDWEYRIPGRQNVQLKAEDVLVATYADTADYRPTGIGPLEVALREWGLINSLQDFVKGFFDGGALPVYALIPADDSDLDQEDADLLAEKWIEKTLWAPGSRQRPPVLKSIKGIERLSFDYNELAYSDLRNISEVAICQAFGVNPSMASQMFGIEHNTYSNVSESKASFFEDTVVPLWARLDDLLTRNLLPEFEDQATIDQRGISLEFDTRNIAALQEDSDARSRRIMDAASRGLATRAMWLKAEGLMATDADEVYLMPFSVVEVPASGGDALRASVRVQEPAHRALPDPDTERRARGLVALQTRDRLQRRALAQFQRAETTYGPKFYQYFQEQKGRIIAALSERGAAGPIETRDIADLIALDWSAEDEELERLIRQLWDVMGGQATAEAATLISSDSLIWEISNPWVRQVLDQVATRVTQVSETTKADIRRVLGTALEEGTSIPDLTKRLEGLYEETYKGRSQTIARTESMIAYGEASIAGYAESGQVAEVEFADNPDHSEPYKGAADGLTCAQRHGLIAPLERASFHLRSDHPNGSAFVIPILAKPLGVV